MLRKAEAYQIQAAVDEVRDTWSAHHYMVDRLDSRWRLMRRLADEICRINGFRTASDIEVVPDDTMLIDSVELTTDDDPELLEAAQSFHLGKNYVRIEGNKIIVPRFTSFSNWAILDERARQNGEDDPEPAKPRPNAGRKARVEYSPIAIARNIHGMTQAQLARELNVLPQTLYNWEHQLRTPNAESAAKIASILNVDESWIRGTAQFLPFYDSRTGATYIAPIVRSEIIGENDGILYHVYVEQSRCLEALILCNGMQLTPVDGAQPQAAANIPHYSWIDASGNAVSRFKDPS